MRLDALLRHIDQGHTTYDPITGTAHTGSGDTVPAGMVRYALAAGLAHIGPIAGGRMLWLGLTDAGISEVNRGGVAA